RCLAAGMDDYISKPVGPEQLESVLRRWIPEVDAPASVVAPRPPEWAPRAGGSVDWDVLSELLAMTRPEFVQDLLGLFLRDSRRMLGEMEQARARGDLGAWKQMAHKLRG